MNINYLKEKEHYGNNEYVETQLNFKKNNNAIIFKRQKKSNYKFIRLL